MTLSEACIRRPVMTTLITAAIIVFGLFAYRLLSVSALPEVDFPTVEITATLPGASPETMAASVASPIERQMSTIAGISSMTSSSSQGRSRITIQFDLGRNIDAAALDVQTALTIAQRRLPAEMTTPPSFRKVNPGDSPILFISNMSENLPLSVVHEYADTVLAQQISQITGVAQVLVYGAQKFAVRVQVDPVAAAARGLSLDDVRNVVSRANSNVPVGTLSGSDQNVTLQASGQLERAAAYRDVVVAWRNGAPVKLEEIARVVDSVENDQVASWFNDRRSIVLAIQRQPDANTVAVVDAIMERLPQLRAQVPASIELQPLLDRSLSIRQSVIDVQMHMAIALGLVILVIFLFLRSMTATIIPGLAVPISLIGTCAVMYALGFSINNMTLLALTLSIGFVVDDAIVMLENIMRHVEGGMRPFEAAFKGAREIGFTIVSITFSLIAVFIPVLLMGGVVGRVFREFAVTISAAIVISGFVALTLTPMLCARMLRSHHEGEIKNPLLRGSERVFQSWLRAYEWSLDKVLTYKFVTLLMTFATLGLTAWLYIVIPKGFFPPEDTGFLMAITEAPSDTSFESMTRRQHKIMDVVRADPAVDYINATVGAGGPNPTSNFGRMFIALKPKDEREPAGQVIQRLRRATAQVVGVRTSFRMIQNINVGGRITRAEYMYTMQSGESETLYNTAPEMLERIARIPGLQDVSSDLNIRDPQMVVEINREQAAVYGITTEQVRQELYNAFGSRQVSTIFTSSNDYQVILEVAPEFRQDPNALSKIYLKTNATGGGASGESTAASAGGVAGAGQLSGPPIPLSAVTRMVPKVGPLEVNHQGQQPAVTISFNLAPGVSLGQAVEQIQAIERESNLPATITTSFQGTAQVFQDSLAGQGILLLAAIFAAYVVLGILYESFIHPITIISGLPSAGVGALLTLLLFGLELTVIAMIGIVMLVGIVKKNAIMIIDFAIDRRRIGMAAEPAVREACLLRFRPIMMTTFAAIFGILPIAFGTGAGAELRAPLGIAVVGGLLLSQLLTLYITPVIYIYLDRLDRRLKRRLEPQMDELPQEELKPAVAAE